MSESERDQSRKDEVMKDLEVAELDDENLEGVAGGVGALQESVDSQTNPGCTNNCNC